jgi:NADH:ubiquinone oxidoreductase subunit 4 (subunit M)
LQWIYDLYHLLSLYLLQKGRLVNRKIEAASSFFLYTFFGSLLLFIALLVLYSETGHLSYEMVLSAPLTFNRQKLLWLAFFLSLAIKIPLLPFHLWLIEAHVEAPTAASVLLAAILLKLGGYGFIRFSIPLFPEATYYYAPMVMTIALIGVIYTSIASLAVLDLKKVIAYSSIAHMNMAIAALFSNSSILILYGLVHY